MDAMKKLEAERDSYREENALLSQELDHMRDELSGIRELADGMFTSIAGAQRAYKAVCQRADLLEKRINLVELRHRTASAFVGNGS